MKIIVDLRSLSGFPWSGVPIYTREIVRALTQQFPGNEWIGYSSGRSPGSVLAPGITRYWLDNGSNALKTVMWNLPGSRLRNREKADVYFLPNWNIMPSHFDIPLVLTIHDCSTQRLEWDGGIKQRLWHRSIRIRRLLTQARALLCVSRSTAQELTTFFPQHQQKVRIIPLAAPAYPTHQCNHYCEQWKKIQYPIVVVVADNHQRKNTQACLAVLQRISTPHHVVVVGAFPPSRYEALLAHARVLVYPSLYEGFGLPPQEAMAAGVPVVLSHAPALAEVSGAGSWLMNPLDKNQMQRVLEEALITPRKSVPPQRTWNDVASETWKVFQEVL